MNKILENFIPAAHIIADTFGQDCEVVIHDLSTPQNSVVYTVNSHVTGREVGQSFDHLITHVLLSQNYTNNYSSNYYFTTGDNRLIKSSTSLICNKDGKVIGALCINFDTSKTSNAINWLMESLPNSNLLPSLNNDSNQDYIQLSSDHITEIADDLIAKIIGDKQVDEMKREDKVNIVNFMDSKGIFLIKGAIDKVADKLGISKVTVYSYLDEIKDKTKDK
ncbi:PAS domain-containing protein [Tissierella carlieri]|uniref:helix-turn-helix transcriptional regulator n=1 Tax=Tissierella carlieri TaxID=689904 RepID=UPI001C1104C1|nr:PAS domain-containing protein [Tissierella carlieri]MBU5310970.1 PAS domain-containing protein [Tissierella carlieri]